MCLLPFWGGAPTGSPISEICLPSYGGYWVLYFVNALFACLFVVVLTAAVLLMNKSAYWWNMVVSWTVTSGHRTYPARDNREPQGSVEHRRRAHVATGRSQQPSRHAAAPAVDQLRHTGAIDFDVLGCRCRSAARDHVVRPRRLRGGSHEEEVAWTAARVDVVEHRTDVAQEQQNVAVTLTCGLPAQLALVSCRSDWSGKLDGSQVHNGLGQYGK